MLQTELKLTDPRAAQQWATKAVVGAERAPGHGNHLVVLLLGRYDLRVKAMIQIRSWCLMVTTALSLASCESGGYRPHGSVYGGASSAVETVRSGDGLDSKVIECEAYLECLQRSISACPQGYDVLGSGSHKSVKPDQLASYHSRLIIQALNRCPSHTININQNASEGTLNALGSSWRSEQSANVVVNNTCVQAQLPEPPEGRQVRSLQLRCYTAESLAKSEPEVTPPSDLLGYPLNPDEPFESICERVGGTASIDDDVFSCVRRGSKLGESSKVSLKFCDQRFCQGTATVEIANSAEVALKQYRRTVLQLSDSLGLPTKRVDTYGLTCKSISGLASCLAEERGKAWTGWRWQDNTQYFVKLIAPQEDSAIWHLRFGYEVGRPSEIRLENAPLPTAPIADTAAPAPAGRVCVPGQSFSCTGSKGCQGYQVCRADGSALDKCNCD